jgi:MFS family permease
MVDATNDAGPTPAAEGSKAPFPYGKLAMISSVCFASAISFSGLFPYAGFMVADLMHISPNESGYYAGYLSAAMMLGRVFSSVPWGMYADKHGRKPTLLIGLLTIVITSITFGLSQNMALALCSRFLLGLFNPIIGE